MSRLDLMRALETPDYEPEDPMRIIERQVCWLRVGCGFIAGLLIASISWGLVVLEIAGW